MAAKTNASRKKDQLDNCTNRPETARAIATPKNEPASNEYWESFWNLKMPFSVSQYSFKVVRATILVALLIDCNTESTGGAFNQFLPV